MAALAAATVWPAAPNARPDAVARHGPPAPRLRLPDVRGHEIALAAFRGHPIALAFLATWCEGCRQELPALVRAAGALRRRGLVVLGVDAVGEPAAAVARLARAYHVPFPVLLDSSAGSMAAFGVQALPTTVVIGPDGRIRARIAAAASRVTLVRAAFGRR